MLILILLDVQYLQKAVFSFEKGSNCQNHSSSGSLYPVKKSPQVKFSILPSGGFTSPPPLPPYPLPLFGKPCINRTVFLPNSKKADFKRYFRLFPQNKNFSWMYHFFILKKPKFCMKFHKSSITSFLEKAYLSN